MPLAERFNPAGVNGRNCPRCFRVGSLIGARVDDGILECGTRDRSGVSNGCAARFRLERAEFVDTLVLLREDPPFGIGNATVLACGLFVLIFLTLAGCGGGEGQASGSKSNGWFFQFSPGMGALQPYGSEAQFTFPMSDGVHYLVTDARPGETIQSSVTVETSGAPIFDFHTNADNSCPGVGTFGLYFERRGDANVNSPDGKYEFYRWWSVHRFTLGEGTILLTGDLNDPSAWTSVFGKTGKDYSFEFRAAASDIQYVGFTFGGGCFYGHGVFIVPGSGSAIFKINSFLP